MKFEIVLLQPLEGTATVECTVSSVTTRRKHARRVDALSFQERCRPLQSRKKVSILLDAVSAKLADAIMSPKFTAASPSLACGNNDDSFMGEGALTLAGVDPRMSLVLVLFVDEQHRSRDIVSVSLANNGTPCLRAREHVPGSTWQDDRLLAPAHPMARCLSS